MDLDLGSTLLGYFGAGLIVIGYLLNQKGWIRSEDWRYPALNLLGSVLVMISLLFHPNPPSMLIEVFWALISIYGIWKNVRGAREARRVGPARETPSSAA
ncbi:MAG TPA: hypothetical protein VEY95_03000 [Azospirillaceae bacterium]|nr:hypothetical protein [Azospirillaceae bacterium]